MALGARLLPVRAFFGSIPRWAYIALAIVLAGLTGVLVHQHYAHKAIAAAEQRGEARAYANVARQAQELASKANALNAGIAAAFKEKNREENARIAAAADTLRLRGPGAARCAAVAGVSASASGSVAAGGKPDAAGPQVPPDDRAVVPWGWLVGRAEQADLNRAEVVAWRDWYQRFAAEWTKWQSDAAKARAKPETSTP
jgi:hypothetical protein